MLETPGPDAWTHLQEHALHNEKGRIVDTGPVVKKEYAAHLVL